MTSQSQRPPMDPVVVDALLEALSNDDDFRALFVRDPRAALAKAGHVADDQDALRCLQVTTLASKQELAEARKKGLKPQRDCAAEAAALAITPSLAQ